MAAGCLFFVSAGQSQGLVEGPITFGDVQSAFQVLPIGLFTANDNSAPADGGIRGRVSPFPEQSTHCESDWILVGVGVLFNKEEWSRKEVKEVFDEIEILISENGVPKETMETAIKSASYWLDEDHENQAKVWYQNWGYFIAPGTLALGDHQFVFRFTLDGVPFDLPSSATIVPDGQCDLSG
jgi:hypothetical protein